MKDVNSGQWTYLPLSLNDKTELYTYNTQEREMTKFVTYLVLK